MEETGHLFSNHIGKSYIAIALYALLLHLRHDSAPLAHTLCQSKMVSKAVHPQAHGSCNFPTASFCLKGGIDLDIIDE